MQKKSSFSNSCIQSSPSTFTYPFLLFVSCHSLQLLHLQFFFNFQNAKVTSERKRMGGRKNMEKHKGKKEYKKEEKSQPPTATIAVLCSIQIQFTYKVLLSHTPLLHVFFLLRIRHISYNMIHTHVNTFFSWLMQAFLSLVYNSFVLFPI